MTRQVFLESIARTITDYRAGEIEPRTPQIVERWIAQFREEVQVPILSEVDHVLKSTYYSKRTVCDFLKSLFEVKKSRAWWKKANFLRVQQHGQSQDELLAVFDEILSAKFGVTTSECGDPTGPYIYLDDAVFTGKRAGDDLTAWVESSAPPKATVYVIVIAVHAGGEYRLKQRIKEVAINTGKSINLTIWRAEVYEDRLYHKDNSTILWPSSLPTNELTTAFQEAFAHKRPFQPRRSGGELGPFSSERNRQLLETEMLSAGLSIRAACQNPKVMMRPLGWGYFGFGFGATIVSWRNCPNNCPLALWWGDADATSGALKWFPLFPRKTYAESAVDFDFNFDLDDFHWTT